MGADLIIAATSIREGAAPDWDAGFRFIDELSEESLDEIANILCKDDEDDLRADLRAQLTEFKEGIEAPFRDISWINVGLEKVYLTGGMSWGDEPSDSYRLFHDLSQASVLEAVGFDRGNYSVAAAVESIARQVLGHAYPDKSYEELTHEEILVIANNLDHADEVLMEIMPIVAEAENA